MIPREAVDLILEFEGLDQPGRWPGAASGITLGHGYDLGYITRAEFERDWSPHLSSRDLARLNLVLGRRGTAAQLAAPSLRDIRITPAAARTVFENATLPKWETITRQTFPGLELLPALILGALVSLTFNRGPSMTGDRRIEMRAIRDAIARHTHPELFGKLPPLPLADLKAEIANQLRKMKRLWAGQGLDGLLRRREAEAKMVESA